MRRALRPVLPALAHYFGLHWEQIEAMPRGELWAYIDALPKPEKKR